jgi:hypothetical protein
MRHLLKAKAPSRCAGPAENRLETAQQAAAIKARDSGGKTVAGK